MRYLITSTRRLAVSPAIGILLLAFTSTPTAAAASSSLSSSSSSDAVSSLLASLPTCSTSCFTQAVSNATTCSEDDLYCICNNEKSIITALELCTNKNCTVNDELTAERYFYDVCGDDGHDVGSHVRSIFWTLYAIALTCFGSRMVARTRRFGGKFWFDDWFIVASFVVLTAVSIGAEIMVDFGLGQDKWKLDDFHITAVLVLFYIAEFAYVIESALTKTSIVVLYLRIFPTKTFRKACYGMLALLVCFTIVFVVTLLTYCVPFEFVWTMWDQRHTGRCIDMAAQTYVCAALNIVMDVTIFLMPIPKLMKLETDWKTKVGVILTFMLGLFVTICSVVRLKFLAGWSESTNPTYDYANLALWSLIELNTGVICACLPGMASLFRRIRKDLSDKRKTSSYALSAGGSRAFTGNAAGSRGGHSALRSFGGSERPVAGTMGAGTSAGTSAAAAIGGGGGGGGVGGIGSGGGVSYGKTEIMKTMSVSVQYNSRDTDSLSDTSDLVGQGVAPSLHDHLGYRR